MTRREELEVLIPKSKFKLVDLIRSDTFLRGVYGIEATEEISEEINYLIKLINEIDKEADLALPCKN